MFDLGTENQLDSVMAWLCSYKHAQFLTRGADHGFLPDYALPAVTGSGVMLAARANYPVRFSAAFTLGDWLLCVDVESWVDMANYLLFDSGGQMKSMNPPLCAWGSAFVFQGSRPFPSQLAIECIECAKYLCLSMSCVGPGDLRVTHSRTTTRGLVNVGMKVPLYTLSSSQEWIRLFEMGEILNCAIGCQVDVPRAQGDDESTSFLCVGLDPAIWGKLARGVAKVDVFSGGSLGLNAAGLGTGMTITFPYGTRQLLRDDEVELFDVKKIVVYSEWQKRWLLLLNKSGVEPWVDALRSSETTREDLVKIYKILVDRALRARNFMVGQHVHFGHWSETPDDYAKPRGGLRIETTFQGVVGEAFFSFEAARRCLRGAVHVVCCCRTARARASCVELLT